MIRNAGGVVTEDTIRSLAISQRLLGTEEIILVHHSDCGMLTFTRRRGEGQIEDDTGIRPHFALEAFIDPDDDIRQSIARLQASPFVPARVTFEGSCTRWRAASCARSRRTQSSGRERRDLAADALVHRLLSFPNPVNEVSARLVAAGVVVMCVVTIAFDQAWILVPLAYGFVARVLTGPTLSPLGQLVTRVITPRLPFAPKPVPGPPKRFAQGIGATLSVSARPALRVRRDGCGVRARRHDPGGRDARVGVRLLPGLQGLRRPHARRRDPGVGVRGMRRHLDTRRRATCELTPRLTYAARARTRRGSRRPSAPRRRPPAAGPTRRCA